jgi:hypothetical protein
MISKVLYLQGGSSPAQLQLLVLFSAALKGPYSPIKQKVMLLFNKR